MSTRKLKIPNSDDWQGYEGDLDVRHAHKLLFGKSIDDVQRYFGGVQSISRADELQFMPRAAFQYYVFAYSQYVLSEAARGVPDSASPFLHLLVEREKQDPDSVREIYPLLRSTVEFVANHQDYFDADYDIYGSFEDLATQLKGLCAEAD